MLRPFAVIAALTFGTTILQPISAIAMESSQGELRVEKMADGFDVPWAFTFLPDGAMLVTERAGHLWYLKGDRRHQVKVCQMLRLTGRVVCSTLWPRGTFPKAGLST